LDLINSPFAAKLLSSRNDALDIVPTFRVFHALGQLLGELFRGLNEEALSKLDT
jgi:hypothetical protein